MQLDLITPAAINYQLRPYQSELYTAITEGWNTWRRILVQLSTGAGKTVLFSEIAKHFAHAGDRVLVVAHREELIKQAKEKLEAMSGLTCGVIKAGIKPNYEALVQVASIASMATRMSKLLEPKLIIIDEAHHSTANSYRALINAYPNVLILGVTATPIRTNGEGFKDLYDRLISGITTADLIELGSLSRYKLFANAVQMTTKGARVQKGDY